MGRERLPLIIPAMICESPKTDFEGISPFGERRSAGAEFEHRRCEVGLTGSAMGGTPGVRPPSGGEGGAYPLPCLHLLE
ncbi:hypothetical protein Memar_0379 [Methanoculleus marisnigri JR1]|uniref:Uncharacterized protein n=1 Tax=Methanoculleus marisnigri (strain ATCC 35101 / DSM 1498 / JR1) TaxID=368407 RepID=A3CSG2_METMJ|nr:hypothetical protein Memar_0379 [Methanoculleus marisnigri JR1]